MEQVVEYLKYLKIPVSEEYFKKQMFSHADYPSLLSVSDTIEKLGIPCQIGRIEGKNLSKVDYPFMIFLENDIREFILIRHKDFLVKEAIDLTDWDGVVLKIEPVNSIIDETNNKQYSKEKFIKKVSLVLLTAIFGLVLLPLINAFSWTNITLLSMSIIGTVIGYILVAKELGITYKKIETFCNTGTRTNCDQILKSEGAILFGFLSFSEVVISYFLFQLLLTSFLIPILNPSVPYLWVMAIGSTLTIPVIVYSVYYQAIKVKIWCRLCVLVDILLCIQALFFVGIFLNGTLPIEEIQLMPFLASGLILISVASFIILLKSRLEAFDTIANNEIAATRVKNDPNVFMHLLRQQRQVDISPFKKEIVIGKQQATLKLIMVTNPYCYPCKVKFTQINRLMAIFPDEISLELRFLNSGPNAIDEMSTTSYLIQYWEKYIWGSYEQKAKTRKMISDWFRLMDLKEFQKLYPEPVSSTKEVHQESLELEHYKWVAQHSIFRTPALFFNGYEFLRNYSITDLRALMPGLVFSVKEEQNQKDKDYKELVE